MSSSVFGKTGRPVHSSSHPVSLLTVIGLLAGSLAVSASPVAAASPTVTLSSSVAGTSASIAITVNRQFKAIASCALVSDTTTTACAWPTSQAKGTTDYGVLLASQTPGDHTVTVHVSLTDGGDASATTMFTIVGSDSDGDGVPDAIDNCPTIANGDQTDQYGSVKGDACEDTNGDGILDVNEADMCVSVNGVPVLTSGTAFCVSEASAGAPNIAVANGSNSNAAALSGAGNRATAIGASAGASAAFGNDNIATASGDLAGAAALRGDNNSATATGPNANAFAGVGNNNTATAIGDSASATATSGNNNTATADGDFATATASAPAGCTYSAPPDGGCS